MDNFEPTQYLFQHFDKIWPRLIEHLTISGISLIIALLISLPTGLLLSRNHRPATLVLGVLDAIYTIPSLALFAFLLPLPFIRLGAQPAIIALVAYSLFALVRNTMVAFDGVDPAIKEAALGMGMSSSQILWRIEVPLALPVIIAGVRIATLSTISLTAVAAWIGAGGLGLLLKEGIDNPSKLYAGVIVVSLMAIGADLLFRVIERIVSVPAVRRTRRRTALLAQPKQG
jgi:osmoprotectant transport system permease protein